MTDCSGDDTTSYTRQTMRFMNSLTPTPTTDRYGGLVNAGDRAAVSAGWGFGQCLSILEEVGSISKLPAQACEVLSKEEVVMG